MAVQLRFALSRQFSDTDFIGFIFFTLKNFRNGMLFLNINFLMHNHCELISINP